MISPEQMASIRHLFFIEHWKVGTIASDLGLHSDTIKRALTFRSISTSRSLPGERIGIGRPPKKDQKRNQRGNAK
jgi:hypothetical protein